MLPADVQLREDALLGAAFRRCQKAAPEGWRLALTQIRYDEWEAEGFKPAGSGDGLTPAAALTALAEALEARE